MKELGREEEKEREKIRVTNSIVFSHGCDTDY